MFAFLSGFTMATKTSQAAKLYQIDEKHICVKLDL